MTDLSAFPITQRWPAKNAEVIQLYAWATPNGVKASIALEEMGLEYEAHAVRLTKDEVKSEAFLSLNPNGKIPALIDPNGPDGAPIGLFESGAILLYLGEKTGKLIGHSDRQRHEVIQWLMFQMGGIGPMFGQLGFFLTGDGADVEDDLPADRYIAESRRLLLVLEERLETRDWLTGDYSIADIATAPWIRTLRDIYGAGPEVGLNEMGNVLAYLDRFLARPAVQAGSTMPPRQQG